MERHTNKALRPLAQNLRSNLTPEERHLWYDFFKPLPIVVKRQHVIDHYILDFYIPAAKLAIELDGVQHEEEGHQASDSARDAHLASLGILTLRYTNQACHRDYHGVCDDITHHIEARTGRKLW